MPGDLLKNENRKVFKKCPNNSKATMQARELTNFLVYQLFYIKTSPNGYFMLYWYSMEDIIMRVVDFNIINYNVKRIADMYAVQNGIAFDFFVCDEIFELDKDEADQFVTDSSYIGTRGVNTDDRGIDILYLDKGAPANELVVNIVNCKYKENLESANSFSFPTNEFAKLESAITDITENPKGSVDLFNVKQRDLIEEIATRYDNGEDVVFNVILCSNAKENIDLARYSSLKSKFPEVTFSVVGCDTLMKRYQNRNKPKINGKIRIQKIDMFDVNKGFIAKVNAIEILRLFSKDSELRNKVDFELEDIKYDDLYEEVLKDNVRKFKGLTNSINSNIIKTAETDSDVDNFFYYNNGLTILCNKISKSQLALNQTVILDGMQVVNGGQTLRCIDYIRKNKISNLEGIYILCRFYEANDPIFSANVAEFTNSQTAVTSRDIKSIDEKQRKLQDLIRGKGYFYQLKSKEFDKEQRDLVIDFEKIAQCLYAFECEYPSQARNNKKDIFASKYNEIFNDGVDENYIINLHNLYKEIVKKRNWIVKSNIDEDKFNKPEYSFIVNADYYILYGVKKLYLKTNQRLPEDLTQLMNFYDKAYSKLQTCVLNEVERKNNDPKSPEYSNSTYFKNNKLKEDFDAEIEKGD